MITMADLILHHYPLSPYSEKIRVILGQKQLPWRSVETPPMLPKPDQRALTGGYRRAPVLQIGADIYCDTALIADVLEAFQPTPSLFANGNAALARLVAQWADDILLWAAMRYNLGETGFAALFASMPADAIRGFVEDRAAMGLALPVPLQGDHESAYREHLARLEALLRSSDFLLGNHASIADFSAYHPLWFTVSFIPALAGILDDKPLVKAWMGRICALGHGKPEPMPASDAIGVAASSTPSSIEGLPFDDRHGIALGSKVAIAPQSFGTEPTEGILVAATPQRYSLRRSDERAGTVHVHFPRVGYVLTKISG
jgi:glutathione S-transferase